MVDALNNGCSGGSSPKFPNPGFVACILMQHRFEFGCHNNHSRHGLAAGICMPCHISPLPEPKEEGVSGTFQEQTPNILISLGDGGRLVGGFHRRNLYLAGENIYPYFAYVQTVCGFAYQSPNSTHASLSGLEFVFFDLKSLPTANAPSRLPRRSNMCGIISLPGRPHLTMLERLCQYYQY